MDRRHFLALGGMACASTAWSQPGPSVSAPGAPGDMFRHVQFTSDGLALTPREYALRLGEAVAERSFGVDNYSIGGSLATLEKQFAALLGKQAAIFVATGTLANHLAIRKLAGRDSRVLVQAESHLYNDSGDCAQTLSGLNLVPLGEAQSGFTLQDVQRWAGRTASGRVARRIGVISIESPVRRMHHAMFDFEEMQRISSWARGQGIRLHLDGARLFNLPQHSGHAITEYTALFDSVYVSLWKHFNAGSGAILAGDEDFIEGLSHERRMFGGALPNAWPTVAVAARHVDSYQRDYAAAWQAADALIALLESDRRFSVEKLPGGTSKFLLKPSTPVDPAWIERALALGVGMAPVNPATGTIPMQVNTSILRRPPAEIAHVLTSTMH